MKQLLLNHYPNIYNKILSYRSKHRLRSNSSFMNLFDHDYRFPAKDAKFHMDLAASWLMSMNDVSRDGGVPRWVNLIEYSPNSSLSEPSFPETTGYILTSLIFANSYTEIVVPKERLQRIKDYLITVQHETGAFYNVSESPRLLAFDTGQILTGLCSYYKNVEKDEQVYCAIVRAANWMAEAISESGQYKHYANYNGSRCYYAQATNGLLQAYFITESPRHLDAVRRNADYISNQFTGSWFRRFSFEDHPAQNLHGISYTLRGMMDLGRFLHTPEYCNSVKSCIDEMFRKNEDFQNFPGHFKAGYTRYNKFASPTGMSQLAIVCYLLNEYYDMSTYKVYGDLLVDAVKNFQLQGFGDRLLDGAIPGSWPVHGPYAHCSLPNWATKFFLDALVINERGGALNILG